MIRKIIKIDEDKCIGCGLCAKACHEGAIEMVNGKAVLTREDYCDGLGDCLPACPVDAISFEEREAPAYDEAAVKAAQAAKNSASIPDCSCPGSAVSLESQLTNFPVQIKLAPVNAPYFHKADLLIAADCAAYCHGNFHNEFIRNHVTLIGCPKLDFVDYSEKLTAILSENDIKSVTLARMTVPCCGGLEHALKTAIQNSGKDIPFKVAVISPNGQVVTR